MTKKNDIAGRGRRLSRDEVKLFKRAVHDATPINNREAGALDDGSVEYPTPKNSQRSPSPDNFVPPNSTRSLPELRSGETIGLDRRTMDRLRRGQIRVEARLDLHGHTQDEAQNALTEFLYRAQGAGKRCVIVITGRGRMGQGGGVLRSQTPRWLNLPSLRPLVLGFAVAQPKDGGAGALYVLLKRRKNSIRE